MFINIKDQHLSDKEKREIKSFFLVFNLGIIRNTNDLINYIVETLSDRKKLYPSQLRSIRKIAIEFGGYNKYSAVILTKIIELRQRRLRANKKPNINQDKGE